jgi:hypothetical protein
MTMKAARIVKPKESLHVQDLDIPKAKGSEVVIKVHSSRVCHSDIHLWEGGYEGIEGQFLKASDRGVSYPLITTGPFTLSLYWVVMLKRFVKAFTSRTRFIIIGSNYLEKKAM